MKKILRGSSIETTLGFCKDELKYNFYETENMSGTIYNLKKLIIKK